MHGLSRWLVIIAKTGDDDPAGQESLTVGSWCPPNSEVHGLAPHGLAVRSIFLPAHPFVRLNSLQKLHSVSSHSFPLSFFNGKLPPCVFSSWVTSSVLPDARSSATASPTSSPIEKSTWSSPTAKTPLPVSASLRASPTNFSTMASMSSPAAITAGTAAKSSTICPHEPRLLRPANFPDGAPGSGLFVGTAKNGAKYAVLNLQGRTFLPAIDDPFRKADAELATLPPDVAFVFVDMHAETTSEKIAMGWYLDGRATAVVGTHTHVPPPTSAFFLKAPPTSPMSA